MTTPRDEGEVPSERTEARDSSQQMKRWRHVGHKIEPGRLHQRPPLRQYRSEKRREHTIKSDADNF